MGLELLCVKLGHFEFARPYDGSAVIVDFEHELVGLCLIVAKDFDEDVGDVCHKIHWVVVDNDVPWRLGGGVGFRFRDGCRVRHV